MSNQNIFITIETQHENYDLELNDKMIMSDLEAASTEIPLTYTEQKQKEYITKARKERRTERAKNKYNADYLLDNAKGIELIKNRFNN